MKRTTPAIENSSLRGRGFFHELKKNRVLFFMGIPGILFFLVFCYFPMAGAWTAFTNYNARQGIFLSPFVGFENFRYLFVTGAIWNVTKNTVLYNIAFIAAGSVTQIGAAIFISEMRSRPFKRASQSVMLLPYFVSYVLVGGFVYQLFNYEFGTVNTILRSLHAAPVDLFNDTVLIKYVLVFIFIWKNLGYGMIIYLATITSISQEYYEAARIDGADVFKQVRYITLPMLKPTFIILLLFALGNILRGQFDLFYQTIGGQNAILYDATDVIDTFAFRSLIYLPNFGRIGAVNLYQSFFGFILVVVVNFIAKRINEDYALF